LAFPRFIEQTLTGVAIAERRIAKIDRLAYSESKETVHSLKNPIRNCAQFFLDFF